jgi:excisionase family DNA binding protein
MGNGKVTEWVLLTADEVSRQLRIPKTSVYELAKHGKIPSAFKVGKHWRFRKDLIFQWIERETRSEKENGRLSLSKT